MNETSAYTVLFYEGANFRIVGRYTAYENAVAVAHTALAGFRKYGTEERAWATITQGSTEVKRLDMWVKREG